MQNMWACILKFEISLIKISLSILVPRKKVVISVILDYVFSSSFINISISFCALCSSTFLEFVAFHWFSSSHVFCVACSGLSVVRLARKGKKGRKRGKRLPLQRFKKRQKMSRQGKKGQEKAERKGEVKRRLFQRFKKMQEMELEWLTTSTWYYPLPT